VSLLVALIFALWFVLTMEASWRYLKTRASIVIVFRSALVPSVEIVARSLPIAATIAIITVSVIMQHTSVITSTHQLAEEFLRLIAAVWPQAAVVLCAWTVMRPYIVRLLHRRDAVDHPRPIVPKQHGIARCEERGR